MAVTTLGACDNCCVNLQYMLDELVSAEIQPNSPKINNGLLRALLSPVNRQNFSIFQRVPEFGQPQAANDCAVTITYENPSCEAANDGVPDVCSIDNNRGEDKTCLSVTVETTKNVTGHWTEDEFRCICENQNDRAARELRNAAQNLNNAITTDLATQMIALVGDYTTGTDSNAAPLTVNILSGDGHVNPSALSVIRGEHRLMRTSSNPIIVGGNILDTYEDVYNAGGTGTGLSNGQLSNLADRFNMYVDYGALAAWQAAYVDTAQHAISWAPGAYQLLEHYENVGSLEKLGQENYTFTTITVDGIKYDWKIRYEECLRKVSWALYKTYDLFYIPDAAYAACLTGNHKLGWIFGCGDFDCAMYFAP